MSYGKLASKKLRKGDSTSFLNLSKEGIATNSQYRGYIYHNMAMHYYFQKEYNITIQYLDSAIGCYGCYPVPVSYKRKAICLAKMNNLEEAEICFKQFIDTKTWPVKIEHAMLFEYCLEDSLFDYSKKFLIKAIENGYHNWERINRSKNIEEFKIKYPKLIDSLKNGSITK